MRVPIRRFLALILVLCMFPIQSLAYIGAGDGTGSSQPNTGKDGGFGSSYTDIGISIGIQRMEGSQYTINNIDAAMLASRAGWKVQSDGLAKVVRHFSYSFPAPYAAAGQQGTLFLIPRNGGNDGQYVYAVSDNCVATNSVMAAGIPATSKNYTLNMSVAEKLYNMAKSSINEANPNPTLTAAEIDQVYDKFLDEAIAKSLIGQIFGHNNYNDTNLGSTLSAKFFKAYTYTPGFTEEFPDVRKACNYAGILLSLAKLLPEGSRETCKNYVVDYLTNLLNGQPYQPVVITLETAIATRWQNNDKGFSYWRTMSDHVSLYTGAGAEVLQNTEVYLRNVFGKPPESDRNILQNIMREIYNLRKQSGELTWGSKHFSGLSKNGDKWKSQSGTGITSLSPDVLADVGVHYKYSLPEQGIWGVGIFGAEEAIFPQINKPPTSEAAFAPTGSVSISVEPKSQIKEVGGYNAELDVTITVNVGANYSTITRDGEGTVVNRDEGKGFGTTLRWLDKVKQEDKSLPDPYINIFSKEHPAIPAIAEQDATTLINKTYGYSGNGIDACLLKGEPVIPSVECENVGLKDWTSYHLYKLAAVLVKEIPGVEVTEMEGDDSGVKLTFTDLAGAADYFDKSSGVFQIKGSVPVSGMLESEEDIMQHWFNVGGTVVMYGPTSLDDMSTIIQTTAGLSCEPKYDYATVAANPGADKPNFYSRPAQPYAEIKQGRVTKEGEFDHEEKFNSMTGTPTVTNDTYHQYFASGGSEFVVQFDGEFVSNGTATRTYTAPFTEVHCHHSCTGHETTVEGKPETKYCTGEHCTRCHTIGGPITWTQKVEGFSYVKITNLKVWKLSEAKLDGTRELLDTDEVTATVLANEPTLSYNIAESDTVLENEPTLSYNIAESDTAADGRLIYSYAPESKDSHTVFDMQNTSTLCDGWEAANYSTTNTATSGITCSATCVSDFIVLRTTNGDQSILYYEYTSKPASINTSTGSDAPTADPIVFTPQDYSTVWLNNPHTSAGSNMPEEGITFGGYNGDYPHMDTKFNSNGHPSNINFEDTAAYKNKAYFDQITDKPGKDKLLLVKEELVIPDSRQNGEYNTGHSYVFYENILNYNESKQPLFSIAPQPMFEGRKGFVLESVYGPGHDKINNVVVYDPVSNENSLVVSLPAARDQRVARHITPTVEQHTCPGDMTCDYLQRNCTETEHLHTEACYKAVQYEVCTGNNVHVHDGCKKDTANPICGGAPLTRHEHNDNCKRNDRGAYLCNNEPLNTHDHDETCYYQCGGYPLNKHEHYKERTTVSYRESKDWVRPYEGEPNPQEEVWSFVASADGQVSFWSTDVDTSVPGNHGLARIKIVRDGNTFEHADRWYGASWVKEPDFKIERVDVKKGDKVVFTVVQNWEPGWEGKQLKLTLHVRTDVGLLTSKTFDPCYVMNKAILECTNPHHAFSYNWKLYTLGMMHQSGVICGGRECKDNTPILFPVWEKHSTGKKHEDGSECTGNGCPNATPLISPPQKYFTLAECAAGKIVRHYNGNVHLTMQNDGGLCSYCGTPYKKDILGDAEATDRVPSDTEYACYDYGDKRCWGPCNDDEKHRKHVTEVTADGKNLKMGDFINLDWPFAIYFPNVGDFFGTGARWSHTTSPERGAGYTNNMDTTQWIKAKWVEFPFAVLYNDTTYTPYERIYLPVAETSFTFYLPLSNKEAASAEVTFGTVAINSQNGNVIECGKNKASNLEVISYNGKPMAHHHNADKRAYIDVVGRIGNMTLNDTGDFRFSNLFKQAIDGWLVKNVVRKVDPAKQNFIMLDSVDIRGLLLKQVNTAGNTYGTKPERSFIGKILGFPLTPAKNNIESLQKQPLRIGYDAYMDLSTIGNYYGHAIKDEDGNLVKQDLVLIKPHYFRLALDTGEFKPVDVYMNVAGKKVLVNDYDSNTVAYTGQDSMLSLNWVAERDRRNYFAPESVNSEALQKQNDWIELPHGTSWIYGNYNIMNLTQRNRTFIGREYTYADNPATGWVAHKDPSNRLDDLQAVLQGQRWHFNLGLPSSAVFVYSNEPPTQKNIETCTTTDGSAVIFCALEVYAQGEVWTLAYDGEGINIPFAVTPTGKEFTPRIPYPGNLPGNPEMPIVTIMSLDKSSSEDVSVVGTQ